LGCDHLHCLTFVSGNGDSVASSLKMTGQHVTVDLLVVNDEQGAVISLHRLGRIRRQRTVW
jgi:hypothetical protein